MVKVTWIRREGWVAPVARPARGFGDGAAWCLTKVRAALGYAWCMVMVFLSMVTCWLCSGFHGAYCTGSTNDA
jgi:hypothetical protein